MSKFYRQQMDLINTLDREEFEQKDYKERSKNVRIYGYSLQEIYELITYAREHGYKPKETTDE